MGHIREERLIKFLENALLEYLKEGNIPTPGELQDSYDQKAALHGDLVRSAVRRAPLPQLGEFASASSLNTFIDNLSEDMEILYKALMKVSETGTLSLSEWSSRAKALEARLDKLLSRCNSLLITQSDATGYISYVEDGFETLDNISGDTTAFVDTSTGEVIAKVNDSLGKGNQQSAAVDLTRATASFRLIETGRVTVSPESRYEREEKILTEEGQYRIDVISPKPGLKISGELKIILPRSEKVTSATIRTSISGPVVIALQYSTDGYTWENVPSESPVQSTTTNKSIFTFRFEETDLQYLKFVVTKSSEDGEAKGGYSYLFSFGNVSLFKESFLTGQEEEVFLYTELRYPQLSGSNVPFARAALEVCDETPKVPGDGGTTIDYSMRAYNGTNYTDWVKTVPINRKASGSKEERNSTGLAVVDFATPQERDTSSLTTKFSSSLDVEALNLERDFGTSGLAYRLDGPNTTLANFYIGASLELLSDVVLTRNIGYSAAKFPTISEDLLVRDVPTGWGLVGEGTYYCAFKVNDAGDNQIKKIELGTTVAEIDGKQRSKTVVLLPGWHTFKTNSANWISISGTSPSTREELEELDPLYPYNHKYIIEGFDYSSSYKGEKVYVGTDLYCQYSSAIESFLTKEAGVARRVGLFDLIDSEIDISIFALDEIEANKTILLLKSYSGKVDQVNERVRLFYTRRYESFEALQLRARLETNNVSITPTLSYYRVRVN